MRRSGTAAAEVRDPVPLAQVPGRAQLDAEGRILGSDAAFLLHLGFTPGDDLIGLPFACLWLHEARGDVETGLQAARAGVAIRRDLALDYLLGDGAGHCTAILQPDGDGYRVTLRGV